MIIILIIMSYLTFKILFYGALTREKAFTLHEYYAADISYIARSYFARYITKTYVQGCEWAPTMQTYVYIVCLAAIVRVSEPLNVLLPPLSIYRYRYTTMETLTKHRHLTDLVMKNNFIDFFLDKNKANCNYFTTFIRRHVFFFNRISRVLVQVCGEIKCLSLIFLFIILF